MNPNTVKRLIKQSRSKGPLAKNWLSEFWSALDALAESQIVSLPGLRATRSDRIHSALANFQRAAEQEPKNLNTPLLIAWSLNELGNHQAALEKCDQVLQRRPDYAYARAERALALANVGRQQEAVDELRRALRVGLNVRDADLGVRENKLGTWLDDLGYHSDAIETLLRSIEHQPKDHSLCFGDQLCQNEAV